MIIPQTLLLTFYPPNIRRGSSFHVLPIIDRFSPYLCWFSTRPPISSLPHRSINVPFQHAKILSRPSRHPYNYITNLLNTTVWAHWIGLQAARFGKTQKVEVVWVELGYESIVTGLTVAKKLKLPLAVSILDDPITLVQTHRSKWMQKLMTKYFLQTLKRSSSVGVVSKSMAETYNKQYGLSPIVLFPGVNPDKCVNHNIRSISRQKSIVIGSVGAVPSLQNWSILLDSVRLLNIQDTERCYSVIHVGTLSKNHALSSDVTVIGFVTPDDINQYLQLFDICFLQLWFEDLYRDIVVTSFPTKVSSYIQAQKPIVGLGPAYSSIASFVKDNNCGLMCEYQDVSLLASVIKKIVDDDDIYSKTTESMVRLKYVFSREKFYHSFVKFINDAILNHQKL